MLPGIVDDAAGRASRRCRARRRARCARRWSSRSTNSSRRAGWRQALLVLGFIFLYKLGDSMATALATPFYLDMGFTKSRDRPDRQERRAVGERRSAACSAASGWCRIGINRGLWLFGVGAGRLDPRLRVARLGAPPGPAAARRRDRLRGAGRRARHRRLHRVHRPRDRPALHGVDANLPGHGLPPNSPVSQSPPSE